jgi:hypothetical protein
MIENGKRLIATYGHVLHAINALTIEEASMIIDEVAMHAAWGKADPRTRTIWITESGAMDPSLIAHEIGHLFTDDDSWETSSSVDQFLAQWAAKEAAAEVTGRRLCGFPDWELSSREQDSFGYFQPALANLMYRGAPERLLDLTGRSDSQELLAAPHWKSVAEIYQTKSTENVRSGDIGYFSLMVSLRRGGPESEGISNADWMTSDEVAAVMGAYITDSLSAEKEAGSLHDRWEISFQKTLSKEQIARVARLYMSLAAEILQGPEHWTIALRIPRK